MPDGYLCGVPTSRAVALRRMRSSGITSSWVRQRSAMPRDRRAWAWLTGEVLPPAPAPASREEASSLPAFGRGRELIASTVANVPIRAYRWDPVAGVSLPVADQPTVLTDPDPLTTPWHWRYSVMTDLIDAGNHVSLLGDMDWRTGRPGWLLPLPVDNVGLVTDSSNPGWYAFSLEGLMLDPADVLHISAGNRSGEILGQGVIAQYADRLGEHVAAERWTGRYLRGGGLPPAVITAPQVVNDTQLAEFRERWRGMMDTGEATIIPHGAQVTPLKNDAQGQQLVESRQWNAQLSAMILGIPPHKLGLAVQGSSMTYANVVDADIAFEKDTIDRWAQPIAATMTKWLLPGGWEARPDYLSRLRTDTKTQAEVVTTLVGGPVLSVDEGRQMIGRAPAGYIAGGAQPAVEGSLSQEEVT